jgi:hypothetical protein
VYTVLRGTSLSFYKDARHRDANEPYHNEQPLGLQQANAHIAADYTKKRNVISLQTRDGAEYLLQARDDVSL